MKILKDQRDTRRPASFDSEALEKFESGDLSMPFAAEAFRRDPSSSVWSGSAERQMRASQLHAR